MRKRIEQRLAGIELEREEWEKTKHIKLLSALFDRPNIETWKIINFPYYQPSNPCRENEFDIEELILEEILNNPIEPFFVEIKDFSEKLEKFLKNLNGNDFFEGSEEESQYEYLEGNLEKYKNWRYWAICIQLLLLHEESPNFLRYKPFKLDENKPS